MPRAPRARATTQRASARDAGHVIEFGELRSLLQRAPSEELWRVLTSVLRLMEIAHPDSFAEQVLPYAERALERWPDHLRTMTQHWADLEQQGKLSPRCAQLVRSLDTPNYRQGDATVAALLANPALSNVRAIHLSSIYHLRTLSDLFCAPQSASLDTISISSAGWHYGQDTAAQVLFQPGQRVHARPRVFRCNHSHLSDDTLRALASQPLFERLEHLDLSHSSGFSRDGIAALLSSPHMRQLRALKLSACRLDAGAARAIQDMPLERASLTELDLSQNALDADVASALAGAPMLSNLRKLDLSHNSAIGAGAAALFAAGELRGLEHLDLSSTRASDATIAALLDPQQQQRPALHTLLLGYCELSDEAARHIAQAYLPALTTLRLHHNALGDGGMHHLLAASGLPALSTLDLRENRLQHDALSPLTAQPGALPALRVLELGHNDLGDGGARALAASSLLSQLHALDLDHNNISPQGARSLLTSPAIRHLKLLRLSNNPIPAAHRLAGLIEGLTLEV